MARQDDYVRYTIRVPAELYERVKEAAGDRSVNAEIIERLDKSFQPQPSAESTAAATDSLIESAKLIAEAVQTIQVRLKSSDIDRLELRRVKKPDDSTPD
jgi:hypothetical protein